ncbi:MAG: hypothetical protein IKS45_06925 [Thermoguttaceae bacterium]|nr:hypothetical protein [Thermoguttaceae bacterium]
MIKYLRVIAVLEIVISVALIIIQSCSSSASAPVVYVKTPGATAAFVYTAGVDPECKVLNPETRELEPFVNTGDAPYPIRHYVEIFPKEIYYGDTIYVVSADENVSSETIKSIKDNSRKHIAIDLCKPISYPKSTEEYDWLPEYQTTARKKLRTFYRDLAPGEKWLQNRFFIEFPPLEDKEKPFWKELEKSIPPTGVRIPLRITTGFDYIQHKGERITVITDVEILVKPRPASEMALLDKWYNNTPEKTFPKVVGNRKDPHECSLRANKKSWIKIGWHSYDPWLFVRLGNRKPCDPNNPTTLNGWRKLEASLTPSTMRDEVRLVRLQLEYYCAKPGVKSDLAKQELDQWLKSLPTPQQAVYLSFLKDKQNSFKYDAPALAKKNMELIIYLSR